jgi:hypothetical protein
MKRNAQSGNSWRLGEGREGFFLKKKQKIFLNWAVLVSASPAQIQKSFCAAFDRKSGHF